MAEQLERYDTWYEGGEGAMGKMTEDDKGGHFETNFS